jgi:hypothetical protein
LTDRHLADTVLLHFCSTIEKSIFVLFWPNVCRLNGIRRNDVGPFVSLQVSFVLPKKFLLKKVFSFLGTNQEVKPFCREYRQPREPWLKGRLSTVDLLVKICCFVNT